MKRVVLAALMLFVARPAFAQDMDAMVRWTSAELVHYKIVGEFSGQTIVLSGGPNTPTRRGTVTDRIEVEFDWNPLEYNMVGKAVIRNFPTRMGAMEPEPARCPASKLGGPLELVTGVAVVAEEGLRMSGFLTLQTKRDQPAGSVAIYTAQLDNPPCTDWVNLPAKNESINMQLHAVPGMMLAMPGNPTLQVSADKKYFVIPPGKPGASNAGWTWTITPTIVK
jgi:hypothetical protein